MSLGTVYTYDSNPRVCKALIAAKYNGVSIEVAKDFQMGVTNKTPEFLKKFPAGKVPAFDSVDGPIYESNAIAYYVAASKKDTQLLGKNTYESALVQQYINFADNEIQPAVASWLYPILGYIPYNKANVERAQEDLKKSLAVLDKILLDKTYLVGNVVTLADISVFSTLLTAFSKLFDPAFRGPFVNVTRWFVTIANQPNVKAVLGEVTLAEVAEVYDPKKFQKKEEKPKEEKKKEEKPKEEKKPKKKADDDEEEEESYEDEAPKGKNPLDLLPPSKFNLEDWKRFYSNNDTKPTAMNWFWEHFDAEGFSIWRVNYKYNNELTQVFMSSNLIGGFFQRLEKARKYAFGSMIVTGTDNNNEIAGYFVFRGQDVPFEVTDAPDFPSYDFIKVADLKDETFRETFADYLAWDGKLEGKTFAQGKVYK